MRVTCFQTPKFYAVNANKPTSKNMQRRKTSGRGRGKGRSVNTSKGSNTGSKRAQKVLQDSLNCSISPIHKKTKKSKNVDLDKVFNEDFIHKHRNVHSLVKIILHTYIHVTTYIL